VYTKLLITLTKKNMKKGLARIVFFTLLATGCTSSAIAENRIPAFLEEGGQYTFIMPLAGELDVKVIKIDKSSGWVQIESKNKNLNKGWVNTAPLIAIKIPEAQ
jgi:hypothetical protein